MAAQVQAQTLKKVEYLLLGLVEWEEEELVEELAFNWDQLAEA